MVDSTCQYSYTWHKGQGFKPIPNYKVNKTSLGHMRPPNKNIKKKNEHPHFY